MIKRKQRKDWTSVIEEWTSRQQYRLWRRHSDAVNAALLRRWLPERRVARLLKTDLFDEAVTDGLYGVLAAAAERVVGVDMSGDIAAMARRRHPALVTKAADIRRLPFDDASFDTVVSTSTLDHFESRQDIGVALREITRVLRPGGQLLLTLDNLAQPVVWLRSILPQGLMLRLGLIPYPVGKTLGPRGLRGFCRASGLEIEQATAVLHCPRALAVACTRVLERRASPQTQDRFLAALSAFERLERLPTRYFTGYFVAVQASKPGRAINGTER